MSACEELRIKVPGFTIAATAWGDKTANPALCFHGKLDNAASFDLLAPLIPDIYLVAIDFPGTGYSSAYAAGILPHWKNDAFLMFHVAKTLGWKNFDIIAHSLGSLSAITLAISNLGLVKKLVFLDVLGPKVNFIQNGIKYLNHDIGIFLGNETHSPTIFSELESAISDRMKIGPISFQAAQALVNRGTKKNQGGFSWSFDRRLRCVSFTLPYEDELKAMFQAIDIPVCLIRAKQGIPYPEAIFHNRSQAIRDLSTHSLPGGHHVHMDNPRLVSNGPS